VKIRFLFPATTTKVNRNTNSEINNSIQQKSEKNVKDLFRKDKKDIIARIRELDYEWDTERVLELNFACIVLITSILGVLGKKGWMLLSGIASYFMIKHALQGWCPPLPIIRKLGVRTAGEIFNEKTALQKIMENKRS
jgi:hypothetical protein